MLANIFLKCSQGPAVVLKTLNPNAKASKDFIPYALVKGIGVSPCLSLPRLVGIPPSVEKPKPCYPATLLP